MQSNKGFTTGQSESREYILDRLIERIYREEAEASHDEITVALNRLVDEKSKELSERNRQLEQAYEALNMAQAELVQAQKLESIGRLSAGIAHEINTPVQFLGDSLHFVSEGVDDLIALVRELESHIALTNPEFASQLMVLKEKHDFSYLADQMPIALKRSSEGLSRVTEIVKSLKTFSYPDQKAMAFMDITEAIRTTLTICANEYKYVADVELDLLPIPLVQCLGGEVNQVLLNLVVNAAHAIEKVIGPGQERGTIRIRTRADDHWVVIEVEDNGCGIDAEHRANVFDPFFTTKEVGKGTGQGLSIAHQVIVQKHLGELTFETEPGRGTTFTVRLPIISPFKTAA